MTVSDIEESSYLEVVDDLFLGFGQDNTLKTWNQAVVEVVGYSESELATMSPVDFFEEAASDRVTEAVTKVLDTGRAVIEADLLTADGSWIAYEFKIHRVSEDQSVAFVGIGRDISARKKAEREQLDHREAVLRELYQITADRDRSFTDQIEGLLALGRRELGTKYGSLGEIQGDEYLFGVVDAADESLAAGDVIPVEATNCEITASQEETLVLGDISRDAPEETDRAGFTDWGISCYVGAPVYDDDGMYGTFCFYGTEPRNGQFSNWEVTLVDLMSRWVTYELQRRQMTDQRKRQNEKLNQFAGIVSHDLRNPLSVAQGQLELAREESASPHLDKIAWAHDRMSALIDDLLTLARHGERIQELEPVELEELTKNCWRNVETPEVTMAIDTDGTIQADRSRLQQLLENLMRNAVEHGGENVTVTVGDLEDGFYIEDDGPGIPESDRDKVFETGYSTARDGTGFGLNIVKQVVEAHGWKIQVTDRSTGGARFEITEVEIA